MTDKERVRRRLLDNGSTTPLEWLAPAIDGGKPIMRLAPRIKDLRNEGMLIETTERRPVAVYMHATVFMVEPSGQTALIARAA